MKHKKYIDENDDMYESSAGSRDMLKKLILPIVLGFMIAIALIITGWCVA